MIKAELKQPFAVIIAGIAFILMSLFGVYWTKTSNNAIVKEQQLLLKGIAQTQAAALERRLSIALTSTLLLGNEVEQNRGTFPDFNSFAKNILHSMGGIANLQLAPNGIIKQIYPLEGNESALGLDIFANPIYRESAMTAIKKHKLITIGPVKLVQGGVAVIGRAPIYLYKGTQRELFWGFASALIYLDDLLESTKLKQLEEEGYQYKLSRTLPDTGEELVFSQSKNPLTQMMSSTNISLPVGNWTLAISRNLDTTLEEKMLSGSILTLIISLLLSMALYAILLQPLKLKQQIKEKTRELQELAYKDPLTGLPNRRFLKDHLPDALRENQKYQRVSAFMYFDLDNFKRINDTIGHDVGDKVLAIVATRLNRLKGISDKIVRLGGDEFGILLGDVDSKHQAEIHARRVLESIQAPLKIDSREFALSTSLGIAMIPEHGTNLVTILQHSDMALYQAKNAGKNKYAFYNEELKAAAINLASTEEGLTKALRDNQFELYYQPQFDLFNKKILGAEALIRWQHPEKGLISPDDFIPLAEKSGKIIELGYWVIENAITYIARRIEQGLPDLQIHINLSPVQLTDPNLSTLVFTLLDKYQVPAHLLGFEITETALLDDVYLARSLLQHFQSLGICIAIDDFGTGYSSLGQLKNLSVNLLKIDRSFVMDLEQDSDDRKIVEAIIAMAHKLNIDVVAEGIETQEQWDMLKQFNCNYGQGYFVSKPIPETQMQCFYDNYHPDQESTSL